MQSRFEISPWAHLDVAIALTAVGVPLSRYNMCEKGIICKAARKNRALIFVAS